MVPGTCQLKGGNITRFGMLFASSTDHNVILTFPPSGCQRRGFSSCLHCPLLSCIFPCTEPSGLSPLHDTTEQSPVTIPAVYLPASVASIEWNLAHSHQHSVLFLLSFLVNPPEKRFGWRCSETSWGRISWCGADSEFCPFIDKPSGVSVS